MNCNELKMQKEDKKNQKNNLPLYEGESNPRLVQETKSYRIIKIDFTSFGEVVDMTRLELKINGNYIFVRRFETNTLHLPYNYNSTTLSRLLLECINAKTKGYYTEYSGKLKKNEVHADDYGTPLKEIDNRIMYDKPDELRENTICFENIGNGIYSFIGNHENYSGAFYYYIWGKDIVRKIKEHLTENKKVIFVSRRLN